MRRILLTLMLVFLTTAPHAAVAEETAHETAEQAFNNAMSQAVGGPSRAELGKQGTVRLAEGQLLIPEQPAIRMLKAFRHEVPPGMIGLLMDTAGVEGIGLVRFVGTGFVDADAITVWTPNDILFSLNDSLAKGNAERAAAHLPPLVARRWVIPPRYDRTTHTLSWAALVVPETAPAGSDGEVTYRAVAFGRDGYLELSFVSSTEQTPDRARAADAFLLGLQFQPGRTYADVTPTDPRAAGGVAAVMGVDAFRRARTPGSFWSSDRVIPAAGAFVAAVGAVALTFHIHRILRRRARRI